MGIQLFLSFVILCFYFSSTDQNIQIFPVRVTVLENQNVNFSCEINVQPTKIHESIKWMKMTGTESITIALAKFSLNCSLNLMNDSFLTTSCKNKSLYNLTWKNVKKENDMTILMCSMRIDGMEVYSNQALVKVIGKDQKIKMIPEVVTVFENRDVNLSCAIDDQSTEINEPMQWTKKADSKDTTIALAKFSDCSSNPIVESPFITSCKNKYLYDLTWINVTRANHLTTLMCSMHINGRGVYSNRALVKVIIPVDKITITASNKNTIDVNENNSITVQCVTSQSLPAPIIYCFVQKYINDTNSSYIGIAYHSKEQKDSLTPTRAFLKYTSTRHHNNHSIVCKASNTPEVTAVESNRLHLNVKYPPNGPPRLDIDGIDNKYKVIEHHNVTLTCISYGGNPRAKLHWTCDNQIPKTVKVTTDSEKTTSIIIWKASRQSDTVCYCSSTHDLSNTSRTDDVKVTVLYNSSVTKFLVNGHENENPVMANESTSITFTCEIDSNPISTTALILPNGTVLDGFETNMIDYTYYLSSCLDNGVYTCSGSNNYINGQPVTKDLLLDVNCTPMAQSIIEKEITADLNLPVTVQFTVLANPKPEFTWEMWTNSSWKQISNNGMFSISSSGLQSNMTVNNFTATDGSLFRLNIENYVGKATYNFTLKPFALTTTTEGYKIPVAVIAGSSSGVITILGIVFGIFLYRKRYQNTKNRCKERTSVDRSKNDDFEMKTIADGEMSYRHETANEEIKTDTDRAIIQGMENVYEQITPDEERGASERKEQQYAGLKEDKDGFVASNPIYTNLTL